MANVIIYSDERREQMEQELRNYGIDPSRATQHQREMADEIAQKTNTVYESQR